MIHRSINLIGGSGRSGTTLLAKIFKNHSQTVVAPEWRFLIDPDGVLDFIAGSQRWSPYHFDVSYKRLREVLLDVAQVSKHQAIFNKIIRTGILDRINRVLSPRYSTITARETSPNYLTFVNNLCEELSEFKFSGYWVGTPFLAEKEMVYSNIQNIERINEIFQRFIYSIVDDVKLAQKAEFYVEKNTWNILWYDEIYRLLPESKLVHIYRDPRDVVASFSTQTWMPSDARKSAIVYKNIYDRWNVVRSKVPAENVLEISLESLVKEPEKLLRQITSFWGMPWENSLLGVDLSGSNTGRWKKQFDSQQQNEITSVLQDCLEQLGYE